MLYGGSLPELKKLLEGQTVLEVLPPKTEEGGLCKLVLSDGTQFNLCATELGWWIEAHDYEQKSCPCSGYCCDKPKTYCPKHKCVKDVCEDCSVTKCRNCKKACSCDL